MLAKRNSEILGISAVTLAALCVFLLLTRDAWIAQDDAAFFVNLKNASATDLLRQTFQYVPGRNLHIVWQYLAFLTVDPQTNDFTAYHALQSVAYAINVWLFGYILRRLQIHFSITLPLTILFAFWSGHAEVVWWASALPMHLLSTTAVLILILTLVMVGTQKLTRFSAGVVGATFLVAFFTYDQSASAACAVLVLWALRRRRQNPSPAIRRESSVVLFCLGLLMAVYLLLVTELRPSQGGPILAEGIAWRLAYNAVLSAASLGLPILDPASGDVSGWSLAASVLSRLASLVVVVLLSIVLVKRVTQGRSQPLDYFLTLLFASIITYLAASLPSWIWYVSPRHSYLPAVFILAGIACALSAIRACGMNRFMANLTLVMFSCAAGLSVVGLFDFDRDWSLRTEYRLYSLEKLVSVLDERTSTQSVCLEVSPRNLEFREGPFYAEHLPSAVTVYSRGRYSIAACRVPLTGPRIELRFVDTSTLPSVYVTDSN